MGEVRPIRTFEDKSDEGRFVERGVTRLLRERGWCVVPVYDIESGDSVGPQLLSKDEGLVLPDILMFRTHPTYRRVWIEVKSKTRLSWWAGKEGDIKPKPQVWVTGVDKKYFDDYLEVSKITDTQVWFYFNYVRKEPWPYELRERRGCPRTVPVGLFGENILKLKENIHHQCKKEGNGGMIYWALGDLREISRQPVLPDQAVAV